MAPEVRQAPLQDCPGKIVFELSIKTREVLGNSSSMPEISRDTRNIISRVEGADFPISQDQVLMKYRYSINPYNIILILPFGWIR